MNSYKVGGNIGRRVRAAMERDKAKKASMDSKEKNANPLKEVAAVPAPTPSPVLASNNKPNSKAPKKKARRARAAMEREKAKNPSPQERDRSEALQDLRHGARYGNIYSVVFAAVLICAVVLANVAAQPVATAAAAAAPSAIAPLQQWDGSIWDQFQSPYEGEKDVIDSLKESTKLAIDELNSIRVLVEELEIIKIRSTIHNTETGIEEGRGSSWMRIARNEMKLNLLDF